MVSKSNEAFQKGQWKSAWDEAVRAGASREQLEQIAIETFAPQDPVRTPADPSTAADMFGALRGKYGALTAAARSRIVARRDEYVAAHRWMQALELELGAADDPPKYAGAWKVYEASPPWKSSAIADRIEEARTDYQAEQAEAAAGRDG